MISKSSSKTKSKTKTKNRNRKLFKDILEEGSTKRLEGGKGVDLSLVIGRKRRGRDAAGGDTRDILGRLREKEQEREQEQEKAAAATAATPAAERAREREEEVDALVTCVLRELRGSSSGSSSGGVAVSLSARHVTRVAVDSRRCGGGGGGGAVGEAEAGRAVLRVVHRLVLAHKARFANGIIQLL